MDFVTVAPSSRGKHGYRDGRAKIDPKGGSIIVTKRLADAVGLNGRALVLWDAESGCLALKPTGADDPNASAVVGNGASTRTVRIFHRAAVRLTGLTESREFPVSERNGLLVIDTKGGS